jgi:HD-GYP domain-containing protein (c-di-GMP phosphodiesterase class II)
MDSLLARKPAAEDADALYRRARHEVTRIADEVSSGNPCEVGELQSVLADAVESLAHENTLLALALEGGETHLDPPTHMVNVSIFAVKIGQELGHGSDDLQRLALAACLHDVGMVAVPRDILMKPGKLSPPELAIVHRHPEDGGRLLQVLGPEFDWLVSVAAQEHEREDGSGYPHGLKGDEIHEYAKIIGLADVYESMTHTRPYRTLLVPYDIQEIARAQGGAFPERLLKAMTQALSGLTPAVQTPVAASAISQERVDEQPLPASTPPEDPETLYRRVQGEVAHLVDALRSGNPCRVDQLQHSVADLVASLGRGDALLTLSAATTDTHLDLPGHMVNVAIFAVKIGQGIGCGDEDLRKVALSACLHDVGMVIVPRRILEKPGPLSPEELAIVRHHPERGHLMLKALGAEFDWVATVALQEQEREDGSGYPQGLKGDAINEYAKIIGLADLYESLTHGRPYQKRRVPFDAVKEVMSGSRQKFPNHILKGLIQGLSTFPMGSLVRLNSKEIARVIATNPTFPLRPVVEVITGPHGERLPAPRRVDLSQNSLVYITDSATSDPANGPASA